ncbi:hypothetical protein [uncultured Tateyamaria sp.]|uniref:hypothetical protein n=1 Tax=uncultured Tateyamaria sp. TaxID=455651 RepID=UPI002605333A|nr:hypothetical protein [uncultured Tateyamaria sp.]
MQAVETAEFMGETEKTNVLGRIAAAGREERQARAMTLQKAMRITVAKVADALMDLPMAVIGAVIAHVEGDEIEAQFKDGSLLMLLDGPDGHSGAAVLDQTVVGAVIQQQTIGSVLADTGATRSMTRTDAAICAPLIDALLERVRPILDTPEDAALVDGFRFGARAEDARTLAMAFDAQDYATIRLTLDIARGARQGELLLVLPMPDPSDSGPGDGEGDQDAEKQASMTDTVMALNADLNMVVCQVHLPLKALQRLAPGDELPLAPGTFPNVQITTHTGRVVGRGIVGHVDGVRAVKPQRKPSHASQPMRRVSDEPMVEMPQVQEISGPSRRAADAPDVSEAEVEAAMAALPPIDPPGADAPHNAAEATDADTLPALAELPNLDDLPDLTDLPDLSDLPDLAATGAG